MAMTTLMVPISDELAARLQQMSEQTGVRPEELAGLGLEEWIIASPGEDFEKIKRYIFKKNAELYRRLA
jgi:hypothetical protein